MKTCPCGLTKNPDKIIVHGAKEHNLKNICFEIPKGKLVALTGPSGSGKSSIATDILQKECLRQYLESLGLTTDHIAKAKVDHILGLSPSIGVSQRVTDFNPRSTVGTKTGILTILRNLFAVCGRQPCGSCGKTVKQPHKLTTVEASKKKSYFDCPHCGQQLEKLKIAHFSSNAASGACETCKGAGEMMRVDIANLLDEDKTIATGGVRGWEPALSKYYEGIIQAASKHYRFPFDTALPIRSYTQEQKNFLLYGITFPDFVQMHKHIKEPKKVSEGKFEGVVPHLLKSAKNILHTPCPECNQFGLGKIGREAKVAGKTIVEVAGLPLCELLNWLQGLDAHVSEEEGLVLAALSSALNERTSHLIEVGLSYLTLDRSLPTLSAGESQRLRLAGLLGSGLTGVLYVLD